MNKTGVFFSGLAIGAYIFTLIADIIMGFNLLGFVVGTCLLIIFLISNSIINKDKKQIDEDEE